MIPTEEAPAAHSRGAEGVSSWALPPHFLWQPMWPSVQEQEQKPCINSFPQRLFTWCSLLFNGLIHDLNKRTPPPPKMKTQDWKLLSRLTGLLHHTRNSTWQTWDLINVSWCCRRLGWLEKQACILNCWLYIYMSNLSIINVTPIYHIWSNSNCLCV